MFVSATEWFGHSVQPSTFSEPRRPPPQEKYLPYFHEREQVSVLWDKARRIFAYRTAVQKKLELGSRYPKKSKWAIVPDVWRPHRSISIFVDACHLSATATTGSLIGVRAATPSEGYAAGSVGIDGGLVRGVQRFLPAARGASRRARVCLSTKVRIVVSVLHSVRVYGEGQCISNSPPWNMFSQVGLLLSSNP